MRTKKRLLFLFLMGSLLFTSRAGAPFVTWDPQDPQGGGGGGIAVPAFPGAEGWGARATGGRGGSVVKVNSLLDPTETGKVTLRDALMQTQPRIIVFAMAGTIVLHSPIVLSQANSNFTLAGQTAPGNGIVIAGYDNRDIAIGCPSNPLPADPCTCPGATNPPFEKLIHFNSVNNAIRMCPACRGKVLA